MTAFIGMAPDKGTAVAQTIEDQAASLGTAAQTVTGQVQGAEWVGEDRESFLHDYYRVKEAIDIFQKVLHTQGQALREQAQAQAQASSSDGGAGAPGAPGGSWDENISILPQTDEPVPMPIPETHSPLPDFTIPTIPVPEIPDVAIPDVPK